MSSVLRLFAKQDIPIVDSHIKAGEEVRIGKIFSDGSKFMVICKNDNLHKWLDITEYSNFIEDRLVDLN
jgi:hypothetical protein